MKEFWAKNKVWLILVLIVLILVISVIVSETKTKSFDEEFTKLLEEYSEKFNGKGTNIAFIMRDSCSWCEQFSPIVEEVAEEYNLDIYKVNIESFYQNESKYNEFLKIHEYLSDVWSGGTPAIVVLKDGKVVKDKSGYQEKDAFVEFLQEAKVIK